MRIYDNWYIELYLFGSPVLVKDHFCLLKFQLRRDFLGFQLL